MGDINHIGTFLRSTLVKDPFCLGDFLEPKDVLRIEAEFPELFKPRSVATSSSSLKYTKPASGTPYKTPLIQKKHGQLPTTTSNSTKRPPVVYSSHKTFQRPPPTGFMCSRGLRCLPQITIQQRPRMSTTPAPARGVAITPITSSRAGSSTSCGTQTQYSVLSLKKKPIVTFSTSITENPSGRRKTPITQHHNARLMPGSNVWHLVSSSQIQHQQNTNFETGSKISVAEAPKQKIGNPEKNEKEKHNPSPAKRVDIPAQKVVRLKQELHRVMSQSSKKKISLSPAPGFIRPVFSTSNFYYRKSRSRSLPISQSIEIEDDSSGRSMHFRKGIAKYEEIFENEEEPEILQIFAARKMPATSARDTSKRIHHDIDDVDEIDFSKTLHPPDSPLTINQAKAQHGKSSRKIEQEIETKYGSKVIPSLEQLLFAELLASKYKELGKFGKKPNSGRPDGNISHSIEGEILESQRQKTNETVEIEQQGSEVECKITSSHKRILEKLARELIRSELQQCLERCDESNHEKLDFAAIGTQTDTPPKSAAETLQFYRDGIKKMIDIGIGTNSRSNAETLSQTTINSISSNDSSKDNDNYHINSKLDVKSGSLPQNEYAEEDEQQWYKSASGIDASSSKLAILKNNQINLEVDSQSWKQDFTPEVRHESEVEEMTDEMDNSPLNIMKTFRRLNTILEEAINISSSMSDPLTGESPKFRSNIKHAEERNEKSQNSPLKPTLRPYVSLNETNDVTDCSSISDFLFSENKSPSKPMYTAQNNITGLDSSKDIEKPMSPLSKIERFMADQNIGRVPLPAGLEQSISLLRVSIPEAEKTELSGSVSSAIVSIPVSSISKDSSVSKDHEIETSSNSRSIESYEEVYTKVLSHGEFLGSSKKSVGEISSPLTHSPGLHSIISESEESSSDSETTSEAVSDFGESDDDDETSYSQGQKSSC